MVTTSISFDSEVPLDIDPTLISIVSSSSNETSLNAVKVILFVAEPAGISIDAPRPILAILFWLVTYNEFPLIKAFNFHY